MSESDEGDERPTTLAPGLSAEFEHVVADEDTARALGSGDVMVLGTPRVLALAEQATLRALDGQLAPDETSVGTRVELDHLRPSRAGESVHVTALLTEVAARRLTFEVRLTDDAGRELAVGQVVRSVAPRSRFEPAP